MKTETSETQAMAQLNSVCHLVIDLNADMGDGEDARVAITEDALSVEVRTGWRSVEAEMIPEEYSILLCTGGPAVRITGELDQYMQPHTAEIQHQDWGTSWQKLGTTVADDKSLLDYARCFYFGE
jgi:hypothetical protein